MPAVLYRVQIWTISKTRDMQAYTIWLAVTVQSGVYSSPFLRRTICDFLPGTEPTNIVPIPSHYTPRPSGGTEGQRSISEYSLLDRYKCPYCNYHSPIKGSIKRHVQFKHTKEKPFPCDVCGKRFVQRSDLSNHQRVHTGEKPYECSVCSQRFRFSCNLASHRLSVHGQSQFHPPQVLVSNQVSDQERSISYPPSESGYRHCPYCPYKNLSSSAIKNHVMFKHTGERPYPCTVCTKRFTMKSDLLVHMRTHTGEKPFKCPRCSRAFSQSSHLHVHLRSVFGCGKNMTHSTVQNTDANNLVLQVIELDVRNQSFHVAEEMRSGNLVARSSQIESSLAKYASAVPSERPNLEQRVEKQTTTSKSTTEIVKCFDENGRRVFCCPFCPFTSYNSVRNVEKHVRYKHTGEKPFTCYVCYKSFADKYTLDRHLRIHSGVKPYECSVCGKKFLEKTHLKQHMFYVHKLANVQCSQAFGDTMTSEERTCKSKTVSGVYKTTDASGRPIYQCPYCSYVNATSSTNVKSHIKYHHTGEMPYGCSVCSKNFPEKSLLERHMRIHTGEKPFQCQICLKKFNQKCNLKNHMIIASWYHRSSENATTTTSSSRNHKNVDSAGRNVFRCPYCPFTSCADVNLVKMHIRYKHSGKTPFACPVCFKLFNDNFRLQRHIRTHTGERPFHCHLCSKKFSQKNGLLDRNVEIPKYIDSSGGATYRCPFCSYENSSSITNVKSHIRYKHTGEKPFGCFVCSKRFPEKFLLERHMRIHTGEKPYSCSICQKKFNQNCHLKKHLMCSHKLQL
ncbi:Zinc finger protein [Armadillidium vulgare]|nr:Zinc finger protein [Armadillidium vulgare]